MAYPPVMDMLSRRRPWREPPIVFQILVLLVGGLVVAQFVTLLLTLVLPPAPPAQHSLDDVVAALRGQRNGGRLTQTIQSGPPDASGPGWFTSSESRHDLASRLGADDDDVRLSFFAPLPFAGITAPPSQPPMPVVPAAAARAVRQISWQASPEPLRSLAARLAPASLLLVDQAGPPPGGGGGGAGFPAGGFPSGGGFPGGTFQGQGFPGDRQSGGFQGRAGERGGQPGNRASSGADILQQDRGQRGYSPSPSDLARQPVAPGAQDRENDEDRRGDERGGPSFSTPDGRALSGQRDFNQHVAPIENPTPFPAQAAPVTPPVVAQSPSPPRQSATNAQAAVTKTIVENKSQAEAKEAAVAPPPAVTGPAKHTTAPREEAQPLPIIAPSRALFGLAPSPFVEGDFVAALRQPDGRWAVVQPVSEGFPNAWQRRVMLWFGIAFALVAPVGWLYARHIVRPLARFTIAAEQLGRDPSAALVALEGPAEIGRAAHAFNVMQNRLRSFVDDRTAMVGAISHDLRTPLTRLRFRIEEVENEAVREGMNDEVTEMEAMITSVLTFIRDASTPNVRERLDLGLLVDDVAQDAALIGGDVTVEQTALAPVEVDVLGVRRLLTNLVENAVKYGDRARIRLAIDDDAAIAEICDDGPGVPEDELERAFEPFYRASNAAQSGKNGTGLGLAVCRSIARAHGGDVRLIRSAEGFSAQLRLPLAYDAATLAA